MGKKPYTIALVGLETIKNDDGSVKHFSDTFLDNTITYRKDHPEENVEIIDARDFREKPKPMSAIWERLAALSEEEPIHKLLYSGHSGSTQLYFFSKVRQDVPENERYFNQDDDWQKYIFMVAKRVEWTGSSLKTALHRASQIAQIFTLMDLFGKAAKEK
jgi:hypothetical protein